MKKKKEANGALVNLLLAFGGIIFMILFIHYTYEWFHWFRDFYGNMILILIPIVWSQPILAILGKRTIGYVIADKINKKNKVKDINSK